MADGWLAVSRLDELAEGKLHPRDVGGHPVVLVRLGTEVFALDGRCPHRGGPIDEGKLDGETIRCPWHGFEFDVRTGAVVWPDGWDPLPHYATRVRQDSVEVAVEYPSQRHLNVDD